MPLGIQSSVYSHPHTAQQFPPQIHLPGFWSPAWLRSLPPGGKSNQPSPSHSKGWWWLPLDFDACSWLMPVQLIWVNIQQVHIEWDDVRLLNQSSWKIICSISRRKKHFPLNHQKDLVNELTYICIKTFPHGDLPCYEYNLKSKSTAKLQTWCVVHEPSVLREQVPLDLIARISVTR